MYVSEFAWLFFLVLSAILYGIYCFMKKVLQDTKDMELLKGEGILSRYCTDSGYTYFYIQFQHNGRTYEDKCPCRYPKSYHYSLNDCVPILYHIHDNGCVTVYIDNEKTTEYRNQEMGPTLLYISLGVLALAALCFIYSCVHYW